MGWTQWSQRPFPNCDLVILCPWYEYRVSPSCSRGQVWIQCFRSARTIFSCMLANLPLPGINFHIIAHVPAQIWSSLKCKNIKKLSSPVLKIFTVFLCNSLYQVDHIFLSKKKSLFFISNCLVSLSKYRIYVCPCFNKKDSLLAPCIFFPWRYLYAGIKSAVNLFFW